MPELLLLSAVVFWRHSDSLCNTRIKSNSNTPALCMCLSLHRPSAPRRTPTAPPMQQHVRRRRRRRSAPHLLTCALHGRRLLAWPSASDQSRRTLRRRRRRTAAGAGAGHGPQTPGREFRLRHGIAAAALPPPLHGATQAQAAGAAGAGDAQRRRDCATSARSRCAA